MSVKTQERTVVISVPSVGDRDRVIRDIYTNLTSDLDIQFSVVQDQVNRIKLFHNVGKGIKIPIRTYIVVVIPIIVDLSPLRNLYGYIDFHLDETIEHLQNLIGTLRSMQGHKIVKGNGNGETLSDLLGALK